MSPSVRRYCIVLCSMKTRPPPLSHSRFLHTFFFYWTWTVDTPSLVLKLTSSMDNEWHTPPLCGAPARIYSGNNTRQSRNCPRLMWCSDVRRPDTRNRRCEEPYFPCGSHTNTKTGWGLRRGLIWQVSCCIVELLEQLRSYVPSVGVVAQYAF